LPAKRAFKQRHTARAQLERLRLVAADPSRAETTAAGPQGARQGRRPRRACRASASLDPFGRARDQAIWHQQSLQRARKACTNRRAPPNRPPPTAARWPRGRRCTTGSAGPTRPRSPCASRCVRLPKLPRSSLPSVAALGRSGSGLAGRTAAGFPGAKAGCSAWDGFADSSLSLSLSLSLLISLALSLSLLIPPLFPRPLFLRLAFFAYLGYFSLAVATAALGPIFWNLQPSRSSNRLTRLSDLPGSSPNSTAGRPTTATSSPSSRATTGTPPRNPPCRCPLHCSASRRRNS
jgi:hypothetical protein